jgi:beta-aspartyl-peptidase (threonine type)
MLIVVHGGIYVEEIPEISDALKKACLVGRKLLMQKEAVDAVEEAVKVLEDDPRLDAGTGSYPNLLGEIEMSASIMKDDLSCGGVAAIKNIKNPISVARGVMEQTKHVLLVGEGANLFARLLGFEPYNPMAELTVTTLRKAIEIAEEEENSIYHYYLERARLRLQTLQLGTVGSVAIDSKKRKAAATSTGGIEMQLPGRVGDSPLIGLGNFAGEWGAVSMTGAGEGIIKLGLARKIADWMEEMSAQSAVDRGMALANKYNVVCGAIALSYREEFGIGNNGGKISYSYWKDGMQEPYIYKDSQ